MKKVLVFALSLCIMFTSMISAHAQVELTPSSDSNFTYEMVNSDEISITKYLGNEETVIIPREIGDFKVVKIGSLAFQRNMTLKHVVLPDTMRTVGSKAFLNTSILTVALNEGLQSIEFSAFSFSTSLRSIDLPQSLESIGSYAFESTGIRSVTIPSNVKEIGSQAFGYNSDNKINDFTITGPKYSEAHIYAILNNFNITLIGEVDPFEYTEKSDGTLKVTKYRGTDLDVVIPSSVNGKSVTEIGSEIFSLNQVKYLFIPKTITSINYPRLDYSPTLVHVEFEGNTKLWDKAIGYIHESGGTFNKVNNFKITAPFDSSPHKYAVDNGFNFEKNSDEINYIYTEYEDHVVINKYNGFQENLVIPSYINGKPVTELAWKSFARSSVISVSLPSKLEIIDFGAFEYTKLQEIELPETLKYIEAYAFYENRDLKTVVSNSDFRIGHCNFGSVDSEKYSCDYTFDVEIYGPHDSFIQYYAIDNKFKFTPTSYIDKFEYEVNVFNEAQIVGYTGQLKNIIVPETYNGLDVVSIEEYAFGSREITSLVLPKSVKSIYYNAFNSKSLKTISIGPDVWISQIRSAFSDSKVIEKVYGSKNSDAHLYAIEIGAEFEEIYEETLFFYTYSYSINDNERDFKYSIMEYRSDRETIDLNEVDTDKNITLISNNSFENSKIKKITLRKSINTISSHAFLNSDLEEIILNEGLSSIDDGAFLSTKLNSIRIPSSLNWIGDYSIGYSYVNGEYVKVEDFKIYGYLNSAAERYAYENEIKFIPVEAQAFNVAVSDSYDFTYNGIEHQPQIFVTLNGNTVPTYNYAITYENNINAGYAKAVVTGLNGYYGITESVSFEIKPLSMVNVYGYTNSSETFVGKPFIPEIELFSVYGRKLSENDYSIEFINNDKVGTAKAIITGSGNYSGTLEIDYQVLPSYGWKLVDNKYMYFENGVMYINKWVDDYYLDSNGFMVGNILLDINSKTYSFAQNGKVQKGLITKDGKTYFADHHGVIQKSKWVENGGKSYFFKSDGSLASNEIINFNGVKYYVNKLGTISTGWNSIGSNWYYTDNKGIIQENKWLKIGNSTYHFKVGGAMSNLEIFTVGSVKYGVKSGGTRANGWLLIGGKWYYSNTNGVIQTNKWIQIGKQWYYFNSNGTMVENQILSLGSTKYFMKKDGVMATGWSSLNGLWYYSNSSGIMQVNKWLKIGQTWYFFKNDGTMSNNEIVTIGSVDYAFKSGGAMASGWTKLADKWYFTNSSGALQKSKWIKSGATWYYLKDNKQMAVSEFVTIGKETYRFDNNGYMLTGKHIIDGVEYIFNGSGALE